ncbi:hypothetical protein [Robbsia andropogonis]|uniref:hypothetical protein n=1 Tax=Robbsia andropogonis TaxID=28092 RepID=UPI00209D567D|nr:hypothetical protein [Robbsia andropogonis]MCP1116999.1 hypothetical protein [Robbsia andropogonis]MCP1126322.1 hypothetical protein [Robbsia andropogonis]
MTDKYEALRKAAEEYEKEITVWHSTIFRNTATPALILEILAERDALAAQVEALKVDDRGFEKVVSVLVSDETFSGPGVWGDCFDDWIEFVRYYQYAPEGFIKALAAIDAARKEQP